MFVFEQEGKNKFTPAEKNLGSVQISEKLNVTIPRSLVATKTIDSINKCINYLYDQLLVSKALYQNHLLFTKPRTRASEAL